MSQITRHRGTVEATGSRCIVVFRELPDDPNKALICYSDSVPETYAIALARAVDGPGQNTKDLYEVLTREFTPDGRDFLSTLHAMGKLHPIETAKVVMHVTPSYNIRLSQLNDEINGTIVESVSDEDNLQKKLNPYAESSKSYDENEAKGIAERLLMEAEDFENEAKKKRQRAYDLRPELQTETSNEPVDLSTADTNTFSIDLSETSQRSAVEQVREAWRSIHKKEPTESEDKKDDQ